MVRQFVDIWLFHSYPATHLAVEMLIRSAMTRALSSQGASTLNPPKAWRHRHEFLSCSVQAKGCPLASSREMLRARPLSAHGFAGQPAGRPGSLKVESA